MRLAGKVAIVSGGSRGMGAFEAELFVKEGAKVVVGDVREAEGRALAGKIGGDAAFVRLDVTSEEDWAATVKEAVDRYGKLDILVNNAGVSARGSIEETTVEDWDRVMDINAKGVFLGTRSAIPEMRKGGGGSIINISSQLGLVGMNESSPQYQASKGAVRIFTKAMAVRLGKDNIRVNSVHPGFMPPMASGTEFNPDQRKGFIDQTPLGRQGEIDEVAYAVLFLASDESSYMHGAELVLDGGLTAG